MSKVEEKNTENHEQGHKLSYEELNEAFSNVYQENQYMRRQIAGMMDIYKKLPFLFKVLENAAYFEESTLDKSAEEITSILFPTEEPQENTEEEKED